ncbi:hypothetical protein [Fibrobacter sp.]|uniref:hypothetical protein n=1 Tax=Fibrobacter sp. TaxID=35828 RepID=UPI003890248D
MKKTYTILAAIAAIVLIVYALLPDRSFEESVFPLEEGVTVLGYDDNTDGGESVVRTDILDSVLSFDCTLGEDTLKSAWCGILWNADPDSAQAYRNWTFVDSLILDVEAQGTNEILLKIWAYDPDVTDISKPKTFRLLMKEIHLLSGRRRVAIPMAHFYIPNFWYDDNKVDRNLKQRHQETIARVEIAPGWNQPRGKKFSLKIYGVKAVGVSNFYFGIVLGVFLLLTIVAVGRRHHLKNDEEEK